METRRSAKQLESIKNTHDEISPFREVAALTNGELIAIIRIGSINDRKSVGEKNQQNIAETSTENPSTSGDRLVTSGKYICSVCDHKFDHKRKLLQHLMKHLSEKPYECKICNQTFTEKRYLKLHEKIHLVDKPFLCQFCDRKFVDMRNLRMHERTHTGYKPFKCNYCDSVFSDQRYLISHERLERLH